MASKYLTIDQDNKEITIDLDVAPTQQDLKQQEIYGKFGYKVRFKSADRKAKMKKRAADNQWKNKKGIEAAIDALKDKTDEEKAEIKKELNDIVKEKSFFEARKWFRQTYTSEKTKAEQAEEAKAAEAKKTKK